MAEIIYYLVAFVFHSTLLLATLWIMILVQRLNYNFLGLLGTAVASGALDMIPHVGHPLAVAMLYYGIGKITRAPRYPDVMFTIVVSWALMFGVKVLAFTALVGDLRPDLLPAKPESNPAEMQMTEQTANTSDKPEMVLAKSAASKAATEFVSKLVIKGTTLNGKNSSVTVFWKGKNYVIFEGETVSLTTEDKTVLLGLENLTSQTLTFNVDGETATRAYK